MEFYRGKKSANHALIGIGLLSVLISCKQQKQQGASLDPMLKSYFGYQVGTYWIFYDSVSSKLDSLWVYNYGNVPATPSNYPTPEIAGPAMYESYTDSELTNGYQWVLELNGPATTELYMQLSLPPANTNLWTYTLAQQIPFQTGNRQAGGQSLEVTTFFENQIIGGVSYSNVYQFILYYGNGRYADTFYINHDQGFLAVLLNDQSFDRRLFLKRCKIFRNL